MTANQNILGKFRIGEAVVKWTGGYTGAGFVRGVTELPNGSIRYLVGHTIEGGTGEFLHVYAEGNLRSPTQALPPRTYPDVPCRVQSNESDMRGACLRCGAGVGEPCLMPSK